MRLFYRFLFLCIIVLLTSCEEKLNNEQAKEAIQEYYNDASLAAGGGTYTISSIEISSTEQQNDSTWNVKAKASGSHVNYSLPGQQHPKNFDYENEYTIEKQNKLWKVISIK